jgi:diguanylate cyclase (GGDEF)-like protein
MNSGMSAPLAADDPVEPWVPARAAVDTERRLRAELRAATTEAAALKASLQAALTLADRDPLTGLFNRRAFERELVRALAGCRRYGVSAALIYLDLDGFKAVNDGLGHGAGDRVLVTVGEVLLAGVRLSDVVARLGGDEFAVLLDRADRRAAEIKAKILCAGIEAATKGAVGASCGIRAYEPGITPAQMLAEADAAMYVRKAGRRSGQSSRLANTFTAPV